MSLESFLLLSLVLFCLGLFAVLSHRNLIAVLVGVELMMNAASLNLMAFNRFRVTDPTTGQVAIFLSIILNLYRTRRTIDAEQLTELRG
jgi:NADH-quinone oxidoreductase subunit K